VDAQTLMLKTMEGLLKRVEELERALDELEAQRRRKRGTGVPRWAAMEEHEPPILPGSPPAL
jgi:hypothetical protein